MKDSTKVVSSILKKAEKEGRYFLLEPEVYGLLRARGLSVPRHIFLPKGKSLSAAGLKRLGTEQVVVKIVSPLILHKSDVGGVAIVRASLKEVRAAVEKMYAEIPARYSRLFGQNKVSPEEVAASIRGSWWPSWWVLNRWVSVQAAAGPQGLKRLRACGDFWWRRPGRGIPECSPERRT